ncbi:MAG: FAD-dependent oxidoreductase, partial [Agathobacter sp.]|nr:FAD-dependent oxidoreductase [Agathobacter sp.]
GKIPQQLYGDFCKNKCSTAYGAFESNTKGNASFANLRGLFSEDMEESFMGGMEHFAHIISGFDRKDAILSGVESRTSSPIRILRNENYESEIKGIYPCGEGAGYAGGITSAAMDGIRVAEAIIKKYKPN